MSNKLSQTKNLAEFYFSLVEESTYDHQDFMILLKQVSDHVGQGPEADKALNNFFKDFRKTRK
ncbi:hypothetical protein ACQWTT_001172 [Acinetobacter baumannii]